MSDTNIAIPHLPPPPGERELVDGIITHTKLAGLTNRGTHGTESFYTPPTSKHPSEHPLVGVSGLSSGYVTGVPKSTTPLTTTPSAPKIPEHVYTSLDLPSFLWVELNDHHQSLTKIHKTSAGFLERSAELPINHQPLTVPHLDENLHSQPPLGPRLKDWRRRSPVKSPGTSPGKPPATKSAMEKSSTLRQLKLTSLFDKKSIELGNDQDNGYIAHTGLPLTPHSPHLDSELPQSLLGNSHPNQGQQPPSPSRGEGGSPIDNIDNRANPHGFSFTDPILVEGDLSILNHVAQANLDWTI